MRKLVVPVLVIGGFLALSAYAPIVLNKIYLLDDLFFDFGPGWQIYNTFLDTPAAGMIVLGAIAYACLVELFLRRFSQVRGLDSSKLDFLIHARRGAIYAFFWNLLVVSYAVLSAIPLSDSSINPIVLFLFSTCLATFLLHLILTVTIECMKPRFASQNTHALG